MRVSSAVTSASCASRVASGSARSSSSARIVCFVSTSDRIRCRRQPSSCGLRRRLRGAVLARDRFLADRDDPLVDAVALKIGQPGRLRDRREHVDLIRAARPRSINQSVPATASFGGAERGPQQRIGAIGAVSRDVGAHHLVGRLAQLRQQLAAADRVERGDERHRIDRGRVRPAPRAPPAPASSGDRGRAAALPPEDGGGAKVDVAPARVERRRMVVFGQRARAGALVPVEIGQRHIRIRSRRRPLDRRRQIVGGARLLRERQVLAEPRAVGEPGVARQPQRPVDRLQPLADGARRRARS